MSPSPDPIDLVFASPRRLPKPASLRGRVVVLDVAFAADGIGGGFEKITGKFLTGLGPRLARWVDHHDHARHAHYRGDPRFVLHTKAEHGACPEIITPDMVAETGPVDTIVAHFDLDGLYSAAKWLLRGAEPYPGADADARAVDTRIGDVGPIATLIDKALRAHYDDTVLLIKIVRWLVAGMPRGPERDAITVAAADFEARAAEAAVIARDYAIADDIALVRVPAGARLFDKTELLLLGQTRAVVAVVIDGQTVNIAASFESGLDFVVLLGLGGGMPTRVSVPASRLEPTLEKIRGALQVLRARP